MPNRDRLFRAWLVSAWAILAASVLALFGGGLRVAFGRHFLSDVVFSWLIVIGVALAVYQVMLRRNLPSSVPGQGVATPAEAWPSAWVAPAPARPRASC